jgi:hypothetical protein
MPVASEATPSKAITVGNSAEGEPLTWNWLIIEAVIKARSTAGLSWGTAEIVGKELVSAMTTERIMAPNKATPMPTDRCSARSPVKISTA